MDQPTFALTLPSDPRMLSVARNFIDAICAAYSFPPPLRHALVLATGEAVSNIVRHAHRDLATAQLEIRLQIDADRIVLQFVDQGAPFDLESVPHLPPGELRLGGRGVFLLRTLMDEVSCQSKQAGAAGNVLRLVKRITPLGPTRHCG